MFAVLLTGAAYVPIDPRWPPDRIRYLLDDTSARVVITTASLAGDLAGVTRAPVVTVADTLDSEVRSSGRRDRGRPPGSAPGGRPGLRHLHVRLHRPAQGRDDRPPGPPNTITDINRRFGVWPRATCARRILSPLRPVGLRPLRHPRRRRRHRAVPTAATTPPAWSQLGRPTRVTIWNSVPALMQLVRLARRAAAAARGCRTAARAAQRRLDPGEPAGPDPRRRCPATRVISLGGATEALDLVDPLPGGTRRPQWSSIPYGKPLANQTCTCSTGWLGTAPVWITGELHIGGVGVARGYLATPSAPRPLPHHPVTGERALPHRRPRTLPAGRRHRVPRPRGLPGQDPGVPGRARRDRARPPRLPRRRTGRGGGP